MTRTDDRHIGGIVGVVAVLMAVTFLIIMFIVIRVEVSSAVSHAEETTELLSSALALEIETGSIERGALADTLSTFGFDRDVNAVVFDADGTTLASSTEYLEVGTNVFDVLPFSATHLVEELQHDGKRHLSAWQDLSGVLPQNQSLLDLRYSKGLDAYVLIRNTAEDTFADMRQTVAAVGLSLAVVMTLLLLLVMFIVRTYRARLIEVATTDELTGLSNRRSFTTSFSRRADAGTLFGATATLVDVDFFKKINDTFGHAAGDEALATVAGELRAMAGEDGLCGRWGGDEFIAVICMDPAEARSRIQETIGRIAALKLSSGAHVTVSIGAAEIVEGCTLEDVVERCDDALYVTKLGGRGFLTVYEPGVTPHMAFETEATSPKAKGVASGSDGAAEPKTESAGSDAPALAANAGNARRRVVRRGRRVADEVVHCLFEAVTKMVPFVAAGGILIAVAFLVDGMSVNLEALSAQERANFGSITPLAASLKDVGSAAYNFMLPVFAAFFARGLGGEEAFMSGFAGGYLASQSSAGFLGAIFCAVVSAVVCNLMRGIIDESPTTVQRVAPILIYPLFSLTIMYLILRLLLEPLAGLIDARLTAMLVALRDSNNQELLGAALGAMMATDMGGPINKCAYHFGLAAIDAGAYQTMAQVMVAGMVPPCGIAFAMLAFPTRFDRAERDRGAATLIMGLGFITEGAIPFAITDPIRIIGASMAGSAAAAVVSSSLGCTLMAPHGGIFVFPVVGNPLGYATALFAGSALIALILGLTRPAHEET